MSQRDGVIHFVAGAVAGTTGAVVTCPLEVVKTRLQSSCPNFGVPPSKGNPPRTTSSSIGRHEHTKEQRSRLHTIGSRSLVTTTNSLRNSQMISLARVSAMPTNNTKSIGLMQCLRLIVEKEGPRALFRGLGPNLVGVAPSRAIYFFSYSQTKVACNKMFPPDSPVVHICSAGTAGFVASTLTNPIWFIKTRLQLDPHKRSTLDTILKIYRQNGLKGFYKGVTASYMGISETIIHFVIYEALKKKFQQWSHGGRTLAEEEMEEKSSSEFFQFMIAAAISKTTATCIAYPHEVVRTRLREEGIKYKSIFQTLSLVAKEEGYRGWYRGLGTQLIRQIPNTAIMMSTYELTVYLLNRYVPGGPNSQNRNSQSCSDKRG